MLSTGRRLLVLTVGCVFTVASMGLASTLLRRAAEADIYVEAQVEAIRTLWDQSIEQEGERLRATINDAAAGKDDRWPGDGAGLERRRVTTLVFYDEIGHPGLIWPPTAAPALVDSRWVSQLVSGGSAFQWLEVSAGAALIVTGGRLERDTPSRVGFVATTSANRALDDVTKSGGGSGFIVDRDGKLLAESGNVDWSRLQSAFVNRSSNVFTVPDANHRFQVVVIPLHEASRGLVGHLGIARDVTASKQLLDTLDTLSMVVLVIVCLSIAALLHWAIHRAMAPIATTIEATAALAGGDTGVEVLGGERDDEIGLMVRSVKVFRDRMRQLRSTENRRTRQWFRQHEFIRVQMLQLADTLPPEGRAEFIEDLKRIESRNDKAEGDSSQSLAVAVEVMAERVRDQHQRLDVLIRELKASLETRTELFQLQQQVAIARRMQESLLPRGMAPGTGFEVAGALVAAEQFDGAFYDYFPMPDGRLAVLFAQPDGGGLAAGFTAATVRSALRVLLSAETAPEEALTRTARLLSLDEAARGYCLAAAILDRGGSRLQWAAAGIDPPILVRRLGDAVAVPLRKEKPLSGDPDRRFTGETFALPAGAALLLVSPGVLEDSGGFATRAGLIEALREASEISAGGVIDALRSQGVLGAGVRSERDRLCLAFRSV